jgi:glucose-6-phosphate-specific signal transduction histidine kinase
MPLVLLLHEELWGHTWRALKTRAANSRLVLDSAGILLPSLGLLIWIGWSSAAGSDVRYIAQVAMFLPMVVLTLRHGWHGTAIGGTAASIGIVILMPKLYDHNTLQAQTFTAFAITTMLMVGTRVSAWNKREQQEKLDARLALALAQRNYYAGERQMRNAAHALLEVQTAGYTLLRRLAQFAPFEFETTSSHARLLTQRTPRLIEHLHPLRGPDQTLPQALLKGNLAQTLEHYRVPLQVNYYEGISALPRDLHLVIYRLICDSVTHLGDLDHLGDIAINVRRRARREHRWVLLHIRGTATRDDLSRQARQELRSQLRQLGRGGGFSAVEDGAATFGGIARQRTRRGGLHIIVYLQESP